MRPVKRSGLEKVTLVPLSEVIAWRFHTTPASKRISDTPSQLRQISRFDLPIRGPQLSTLNYQLPLYTTSTGHCGSAFRNAFP